MYSQLSQGQHQNRKLCNSQAEWWKVIHFISFATGGITFIIGTVLLFNPTDQNSLLSSIFYIIGSIGFLTVDTLQFFTFTADKIIRANIAMSWLGSLFYVYGSIGFYPSIYSKTNLIGILGFIIGSFLIGCSQLWKSYRIGQTDQYQKKTIFSFKNYFINNDKYTSLGVQLNAGIGAWCFFFGTILFWIGPQQGNNLNFILIIWLLGSIFFTLGAFFLYIRHGYLRY